MKKFILIGIGGIIIITFISAFFFYKKENEKKCQQEVPLVRVKKKDIVETLIETGYLSPANEAKITSEFRGRIKEILAEEGDRVEKGAVLIRLNKEELLHTLERAKANLYAARMNLAKLKAGPCEEEVSEVKARLRAARIRLAEAENNRHNKTELFLAGGATGKELRTAEAEYNLAMSECEAIQARLNLIKKGTRKEDLAIAKAEVREKEEALELAENQLQNAVVQSPVSGIVIQKNVEEGEIIGYGDLSKPLLIVADLKQMLVKVAINEIDISKVKKGQEAEIEIEVPPVREVFKGIVSKVSLAADMVERRKVFWTEVKILNPASWLRPYMTARVKIVNYLKRGVPSLPVEAVFREKDGRQMVFLKKGTGYVRQWVETGSSNLYNIEIVRGLAEGDEVSLKIPEDRSTKDKSIW
ncbi:MAG: efflux RND transporter periplasmic adaptor subunit [bacterium]